jgi:thymidylate kinase
MTPLATTLAEYRRTLEGFALPAFAPNCSGPVVFALEGPNGVGKTTLCRLLSQRLGVTQCLGTDEAWMGQQFKTRMIRDADWYASAMFFMSGCFEQMRMAGLRSDSVLIMDRSLWSSLAVHCATDVHRLEALLAMVRPIAAEVRIPHLTIVLEASFETCQTRIAHKDPEARHLDQLTAQELFHAREREFYRWVSRQVSNFTFLNADQETPQAIADKAAAALRLHRC